MNREPCVVIASHVSNPKRIPYLMECLTSLSRQTHPVFIYLSISFNDEFLLELFNQSILGIQQPEKISIYIREHKTPQMRHMALLLPEIEKNGHEWIMFSDDDDTYEDTRVEVITKSILEAKQHCLVIGKSLAGIYESTFEKTHQEHRHEYWCYCIHIDIYRKFFDKIVKHDDVLDHQCCDIIFGEYFRRIGEPWVFGRITNKLYNYRVVENADSVTGVIQNLQKNEIRKANPPSWDDGNAMVDYVLEFNRYLHENIHVYLHDTYLRTVVGIEFNDMMLKEFTLDYPLLQYVDICHIEKIHAYWQRLREIANDIYDIKF